MPMTYFDECDDNALHVLTDHFKEVARFDLICDLPGFALLVNRKDIGLAKSMLASACDCPDDIQVFVTFFIRWETDEDTGDRYIAEAFGLPRLVPYWDTPSFKIL